jgi:predicted RNA methylase
MKVALADLGQSTFIVKAPRRSSTSMSRRPWAGSGVAAIATGTNSLALAAVAWLPSRASCRQRRCTTLALMPVGQRYLT